MDRTINHIDELIGKYLSHEASAEERRTIEDWLAADPANRHYFDQLKTIFDNAAAVRNVPHFDTDAAWTRVRSRLHQKPAGRGVEMRPQTTTKQLFWRIAASIVIVLGVGFFTYRMLDSSPSAIEVATNTRTKSDTLPDGSDVFLNKETKLTYAYDKREKTHRVKLKGEAYFNVQHRDDKTFIVEVDGVLIRDIGTSFNVKAYPGSNTIEVAVEEGEVMFYTADNTGISLRAGGKGIYDKTTRTFTVEKAEPNVSAYKTKFFIFSDSDLATVARQLNSVYDKQIVVPPHLEGCRLTVSFNDEDIDEIGNVIAETLGLQARSIGKTIMLEGQGCE